MTSRLFFVGLFAAFFLLTGCASDGAESTDASTDDYLADLVITDLVEGDGQMVGAGQRAEVHYTLWYRDTSAENDRGEMIQSSKEANRTFAFMIGQGSVIDGWDQGVPGMKVGGTRELQVPYRLAYGESGSMGIPGKSDLIFEIELVSIQ